MYDKVGFKHILPLESTDDVGRCIGIWLEHRHKGINFTVSSVRKSEGIYITSHGQGSNLRDIAEYLGDVYGQVDIPEIVAFGFINYNPTQEQSGIVVFNTSIKGYNIVTPANVVANLLLHTEFSKQIVDPHYTPA